MLIGGVVVAALVCGLLASGAMAEPLNPALPIHLTVGPPAGAAPMARVDPARSGRTDQLPDMPRELWRRSLHAGIELPPVVDPHGSIVLVETGSEVVQLSSQGEEQWHARGLSTSSAGPVLLSDGTRVVLTTVGDVWALNPDGTSRFHADLGKLGRDPRVAPLPRDDGSVVVALGSQFAVIGPGGELRDHASASEALTGQLAGWRDAVLGTSDVGHLIIWAPPLAPRTLGSFGGAVHEGIALAGPNAAAAVVDHNRLAIMDLRTGAVSTRFTANGLEGPPTVTSAGATFVASVSGLLVGASAATEPTRIALRPQVTEDAGVSGWLRPSPPLLTDSSGRLAFVRGEGKGGVLSSSGGVATAHSSACGDAIALVPAGARRFLVACRSGTLVMYGP